MSLRVTPALFWPTAIVISAIIVIVYQKQMQTAKYRVK